MWVILEQWRQACSRALLLEKFLLSLHRQPPGTRAGHRSVHAPAARRVLAPAAHGGRMQLLGSFLDISGTFLLLSTDTICFPFPFPRKCPSPSERRANTVPPAPGVGPVPTHLATRAIPPRAGECRCTGPYWPPLDSSLLSFQFYSLTLPFCFTQSYFRICYH